MMEETETMVRDMARVKMAMNNHKGDITNLSDEPLLQLLREEVDELALALENGDYMEIIIEASDIHNYLLALVHRATETYRSRK